VILRTVREGGELVVEVRDTATGIRPDVQSRLFTQFFSTKAGMGTGLGLAVTRKTIEEHGGRIQVDSVWGRGTSFFIRLPYQAVAG
jgi:signal transduction histidine kinase